MTINSDSISGAVSPVALTMDQAAAALNVSVPTVYRLINDGLLQTFTIGRKRYASLHAVRECVQKLEERGAVLPADSNANHGNRRRRGQTD